MFNLGEYQSEVNEKKLVSGRALMEQWSWDRRAFTSQESWNKSAKEHRLLQYRLKFYTSKY